MIKASAPGKVILFGEHAVVYDKLGIAAAVDKRTTVTVEPNNVLEIYSTNLKIRDSKTKEELEALVDKLNELRKARKFNDISKMIKKNPLIPSFVVVNSIYRKYGYKPAKITIDSHVPKNLGSSSSVASALALALTKYLGIDTSPAETVQFANEGDQIAHGQASGIDAYTTTYGYWNTYQKSKGARRLGIDFNFPLIVINSGKPAATDKTVTKIAKLKEKHPEKVNAILERLNDIALDGLLAIKSQDMERIGRLMIEYYETLKRLGISTKELDEIVDIAIHNGALGVKPTGGWGGGCCIALPAKGQSDKLITVYKKAGYDAYRINMGARGAEVI